MQGFALPIERRAPIEYCRAIHIECGAHIEYGRAIHIECGAHFELAKPTFFIPPLEIGIFL